MVKKRSSSTQSSSAKKKQKRSEDDLSTDEFIEKMRKQATKEFAKIPAKEDLDYMMKSVRALINIVEEIWSNCKDHRVGTDMKFRQVNFIEATVNKQVGASTSLCITTKEKILVEDFGNPPEMPKKLINLISAPEKIDDLPDYTSYLKNAVTLCDNVLLAFLKSFQYHLRMCRLT